MTWHFRKSSFHEMRFSVKLILATFSLFLLTEPIATAKEKLVLGDERYEEYLPLLQGKKVALFSNHTGIVGDRSEGLLLAGKSLVNEKNCTIAFGTPKPGAEIKYGPHILDFLLNKGIDVELVFCPEHGFRGTEDAGAAVHSGIDPKTGIPVLSLYGKRDWSISDKLSGVDALVVDLQDVGLRFYTYYITMLSLMEECAALGVEFIILDRPNPNGFYVDGPVLEKDLYSGVGRLPISTVHSLTLGELACMIKGEGWIKNADKCSLTVIKCQGYIHKDRYSLLKSPSPNLKDMKAVYLYASTCYFEGTAISLGRGTDYPFEIYGSPDSKGDYSFTPRSTQGALKPMYQDQVCHGYSLREKPLSQIWEEGINLDYVTNAYEGYPYKDKFFISSGRFFCLLMGNTWVKKEIEAGKSSLEIKSNTAWTTSLEEYTDLRNRYLLYEL